jgi:hypothetical protein
MQTFETQKKTAIRESEDLLNRLRYGNTRNGFKRDFHDVPYDGKDRRAETDRRKAVVASANPGVGALVIGVLGALATGAGCAMVREKL